MTTACCHKTRLMGASCPDGRVCPYDTLQTPMMVPDGRKFPFIWGPSNLPPGTRLIPPAVVTSTTTPASTKDSNPKDAISTSKVPMHIAPPTAVMGMVIGLLNGLLKYGRSNWREAGVRASVYHDAMKRHLDDWMEGNDTDEDGCDNLYAILANAAILVDARAHGKLNDDRNYNGGDAYRAMKVAMEAEVKRLQALHAGKTPHHYTIKDIKS